MMCVHRLTGWVEVLDIKPWNECGKSARKALSMFTRCLLLLGHKNVNTYTWKSVRSGRATEMAACGLLQAMWQRPVSGAVRRVCGTVMRQVQTICNCCAEHVTRVAMNEVVKKKTKMTHLAVLFVANLCM